MTSSAVTVEIVNVSSEEIQPTTWLKYRVKNETSSPVWLVDDGWLVWNQIGKKITLSYARAKMQPGAQVFGYFPPKVLKIDPGSSILRTVKLTWPLSLDRLWNAESSASPAPGEYRISIQIGYGMTSEPEAPKLEEGVEVPVLRWQKKESSQEVPIKIPSYRHKMED